MQDFPATSQELSLNSKTYLMYKPTLGMQAKMEDDNTNVTIRQFVEDCTNITPDAFDSMRNDQLSDLYAKCVEFAYKIDIESVGDEEPKKQSS